MPESDNQSPLLPILEQLHINFHNARQAIEKEMTSLKAKIRDPDFISTVDNKELQEIIHKLTELQNKIKSAKANHLRLITILKFRFSADQLDEKPPLNTQLLILAAEYLGERGFSDALTHLLRLNPEIRDFIDLDLISEEIRLVNEIKHGDLDGALKWCHEHRSSLKKCDPSLQFELQKQKFKEVGAVDVELALQYGRDAFKKINPIHYPEISLEMKMLYKDDDAEIPKTGLRETKTNEVSTLSERKSSRSETSNVTDAKNEVLDKLSNRFRRTMRQVYHRPVRNMLINHALLGLAVIKTRRCLSAHVETTDPDSRHQQADFIMYKEDAKKSECPACNTDYMALAESVPSSLHTYSKLDSDMFVFPHSNILMGKNRIKEYTEGPSYLDLTADTVIRDPYVLGKCKWSEMIRAYAL